MRKLFLLLPTLLLTVALNAAVININTETADALRKALNSAADGDIIEMAAGTYVESNGNYIAFTGKAVTVRAAEGAEVILQPQVPITISEGGCAHFENVKIDASRLTELANWYEHVIYPTDAAVGNRIILEGCEIYGFALNNSLIGCSGSNALDALTINNCYFHNINKSCVFIENTTNAINISITNSTFANITTDAGSYYAGVIDSRATSGSFLVDHCTFYDVQVINTDYAAIGNKYNTPNGSVVSNCIFAMSSSVDGVRAIRNIEQAKNCLIFNYLKDSGKGIHSDVAKNNCIFADPLFADAANGDFSLAGDWVTMNISPARGAATDGSDLGDPRWAVAETLPSTDFATPYQLVGAKAQITGNLWYNSDDAYLYYNNKSTNGTAKWKIHAEKASVVGIALNLHEGSPTVHKIRTDVLDAEGNSIGEFAEQTSTLPGTLVIPAEGDYTIILHDDQAWTSAQIDNITLSYIGGAVQTMPGITDIDEAWFVGGTRADGKISFPSSTIQNGWVKWNVSFASAATYKVNLTINSTNGKYYTIALQDADGNNVVTPLEKDGGVEGSSVTLEMGEMTVPAGNYILKVTNSTQWSDAEVISVQFVYEGGAVVNVPAEELVGNEAVLVNAGKLKVTKLANGDLKYGDNSDPLGEYVYWNIHAAKSGRMNVIANVVAPDEGNPSTHNFLVELFADLSEAALATTAEPSATSQTGARELPAIDIPAAGDYIVKLTNQTQWSNAILHSLEFEYVGGDRITLPAACDFEDVILSEKAHITAGELWFNTIGDSNPLGQWAKWNVKVADAGTFLFTMNTTAPSGQSYKISIMDGETEIAAYESGSIGSGNKIVKHYFNLAAGNYTVKIENSYSWSQGHVVSLVVTQPSLLTIDEAATTNSVIHDNYRNGTHDIQIIRTIVAGMYNTICLPFDVSSSQLQAIFGSDVELKQMNSAELEGDVLNLNFDDVTSIYRGTPYLIKTSSDVVNPVFTDVEIKEETGQATTGTNADFIGSFVKGEVPAGEDNLFLGPDNLLYFSQTATPIKGMRAYFRVKGVANPAQAIKRARIVTGGQIATEINLVNESAKIGKSAKIIENGQLVIIRDGIRYNVMGAMIK